MSRTAWLLAVVILATGCVGPIAPEPTPQDVTFDALRFETTAGPFVAILYPAEAPESVAFMKRLVSSGYYDGREFNRVIPGFVIQEVDRLGGATDQTERVPLEAGTRAMFSAGALGVARDTDPNSGGSEFFVMDFAHAHLYGNYTVFAQVVEGLDIVRAIARVDTISTGPASGLLPPAPVAVHDRVAVRPVSIVHAEVTTLTLPEDQAATFPLVVGPRTVVDDPPTRYTPEWPANLATSHASTITWYVYTPQDDPAPNLSDASVHIEGPTGAVDLTPTADASDARILHSPWHPQERGMHVINLVIGGKVVAVASVEVPR